MNCDVARALLGAEPYSQSRELLAHLGDCPGCREQQTQLQGFDARLLRAFKIDPTALLAAAPGQRPREPGSSGQPVSSEPIAPAPTTAPSVVPQIPQPAEVIPLHALARPAARPSARPLRRPRWLALAASVVGGVLVALVLWLSQPTETLASELVTHVEGEPASWSATRTVSSARLESVLSKSGVHLHGAFGPVVYASSCWFRGHYVPHLVVQTADGPVTVMILEHEHTLTPEHFEESGFSGLIMPAQAGSIALLSRSPMRLETPAIAVKNAIDSSRQTGDSSTR